MLMMTVIDIDRRLNLMQSPMKKVRVPSMFPVFEMVKANNVKLVTRTTAAMQVQETVLPIF